ncbi:MAG: flagellar hook-length control protein FliK, partial [Dongia sp.]
PNANANAKTTAAKGDATGKAEKTAADGKCTTETAEATGDETGAAASGDDATPATADTGADQAASPATDATPAAPIAEALVQANVPAAPTAPVQATVLLLSGLPSGEDAAPADPVAADPQALAALLAKFPGNQAATAAPKSANARAPQQDDPNAIGAGENPETIGQAKPSEPAPADRAAGGTGKTKTKAGGQDTVLREPIDAAVKPAMQQASLTALAQATAGPGRGITLPEGMSVTEEGEIGPSDLEFSAWSDQLGPGLATGLGRGANLQQSAFLAQLKQNVQLMQPHEQVAVQIQRAAQNGGGRLTVDLQPAELGRVEIKMSVDKDKNVTASVVVDRPATLDLLQRDARNLERILQDAGLQTDSGSLSFSLRNSGGDAQGQNQGGGTGTGNRGQSGGDAAATAAEAVRPTVVATADGYVDLET